MLQSVHAQITRQALEATFGVRALRAVVAANVHADDLWNQFGHDEMHFDNNAFEAGHAYVERQRALIRPALEVGELEVAWRAFGRLTHTVQDFYAHSNYVDLWLACQPNGMVPPAAEIDPLDDILANGPSLRSGKAYSPFGFLSFVPGVRKLVVPLLPLDSHARMNLDSAASGPLFAYAFEAAVKRTKHEYVESTTTLPQPLLLSFRGLPVDAVPGAKGT
jgi:hypothetical protein